MSNFEAFAANAAFTLGQVIFEVPTGIVADTWGRRTSFLLGAVTLLISTLLYLLMWQIQAPFWQWAGASILLGLGFTFFSGATEAWLVDALKFTGYKGDMDGVFAKGQITGGVAMLTGSIAGGVVAQLSNLGVPFLLRAGVLGATLVAAALFMKDLGFEPEKNVKAVRQVKNLFNASIDQGLRRSPVRWLMLAAPFSMGAGIYAFYAMQPYLLELYGDPEAYSVAGLAAAVVAAAQIAGGLLVEKVRQMFKYRTSILITGVVASVIVLSLIGLLNNFWVVVGLLVVWAMIFTLTMPVRQAYLNSIIPSKQRATVLSFDALMSSSGGVIAQPALGRAADVYSYGASYLLAGAVQLGALPFLVFAKRERTEADKIPKIDKRVKKS